MTDATLRGLANLVEAFGATAPVNWERVKNYLTSRLPNSSLVSATYVNKYTFAPDDYNGCGAAMLDAMRIGGVSPSEWITDANLAKIGNIVTCYPWDRRLLTPNMAEQFRCLQVYVAC